MSKEVKKTEWKTVRKKEWKNERMRSGKYNERNCVYSALKGARKRGKKQIKGNEDALCVGLFILCGIQRKDQDNTIIKKENIIKEK